MYYSTKKRIPNDSERRRPESQLRIFFDNKTWIKSFVALSLVFLEVWLANNYAYPYYASVFVYDRELVSITSVVTFVAIAYVAFRRPQSIKPTTLNSLVLSTLIAGAVCIAGSVSTGAAWLLVVGSVLINVARAAANLLVALTLTFMSPKRCALCIAAAVTFSYVLMSCFRLLPDLIGSVVFVLLPLTYVSLVRAEADKGIALWRRANADDSARNLVITEPRSFVPLSHRFFMAMFVFRIAFGFSLTFNSSDGVPDQTLLATIPLFVVLAQLLLTKRAQPADILYQLATMLVVAGLLAVSMGSVMPPALSNALLASGADCFRVFAWFALASIGRQSPLSSLAAFSWGLGAMNAGALAGTGLGTYTSYLAISNPTYTAPLIAVLILVFVGFSLIGLHNFSFEKTVANIKQVPEVRTVRETEDSSSKERIVDARCREISVRYNLTKRESEILSYLARGRNVPFIQEELVISHNTVRTHIKHIYQKMGIHSQQELIDIAESDSVEAAARIPTTLL